MPFTASHLDVVRPLDDGAPGHVYDVALPYRRLGRCRMSDAVATVIGIDCAGVASALSSYEARIGKTQTASELLGPGVDLGPEDAAVGAGVA